MIWKIDGKTDVPRLIHVAEEDKRILARENSEWGHPDDFPVNLELVQYHPEIALITAVDGRGATDGSPPYNKFICYSFSKPENSKILTTYLAYTYTGTVIVKAWDDEKKLLLENIAMFHVDITPSRTPELVIQKHLERIKGRQLEIKGLKKMAEKTFFDMLWNVKSY